MRAVWSFWSHPYQLRSGRTWYSPLHHLLAWGLSFRAAQRHYPETVLITDTPGKKLLAENLGLPFTYVSTELDRLADADPNWWALGKLVAYSLQDEPFVHLDTDVFLWQPLPPRLVSAPVFAQCPEYFPHHARRSAAIENSFAAANLPLPPEWEWTVSRGDAFIREENCGILGGARPDFLRYYARRAMDLILDSKYAAVWSGCEKSNMVLEQFLLSACADFHRIHPDSPFRGVAVRYLFSSWDEAADPDSSARAGFTHLLGDSKSHGTVARRIEERMRREDVDFYRRSERVARNL
jgi:hypothetical protein